MAITDAKDFYPELLSDIRDKFSVCFVARGVELNLANALATEAAEVIRREWGGQNVHIRTVRLHGGAPLLREIADRFGERFIEHGVEVRLAVGLATEAVELIRREWGGQPQYIPKGVSHDVQMKRRDIAARWTGRNTRELCKRYGITERQLRRLAAEGKAGPSRLVPI